MLDGHLLDGPEDAVDHLAEHRVAGRGGDGPLAELEGVQDVGPGPVVALVELDADDEADLALELRRDPAVDGPEGDGVGVGVGAPDGLED